MGDPAAVDGRGEAPATKTCPRCGAELFADMDVCYGCLYDFTRPKPGARQEPQLDDRDGTSRERGTLGEGMEDLAAAVSADATLDIPPGAFGVRMPEVPSLRVRCSDLDVTVPLGAEGLLVGRAPDCDVVLHSVAVSRRHLRVEAKGGVVCVKDLGSTNPAMLRGREVTGVQVVREGETVDVCGTLLTPVGTE